MNLRRTIALAILPAVAALVTGCGGGGSDSTPTPVVNISGLNSTSTLNRTDQYSITIGGSGNNVTIAASNTVVELTISGLNNIVNLTNTATIQSIKFSGSGNIVSVPTGYSTSVSDTGLNNRVIQR